MLPHLLTNFETQKQYQNEPKVNGVYSRNSLPISQFNHLPKMKDGAFVINLDKFKPVGTHWMAWHVNGNSVTYFDSLLELQIFQKDLKNLQTPKVSQQISIEYKPMIQ